jgi:hypothetical protein
MPWLRDDLGYVPFLALEGMGPSPTRFSTLLVTSLFFIIPSPLSSSISTRPPLSHSFSLSRSRTLIIALTATPVPVPVPSVQRTGAHGFLRLRNLMELIGVCAIGLILRKEMLCVACLLREPDRSPSTPPRVRERKRESEREKE